MVLEKDGWLIHRLGERIDSFNHNEFRAQIDGSIEQGHRKIGLDLRQTKFLSLPSIRMIVDWAERLRLSGGEFMLLAPSEKLKRQIGIFGSLEQMLVSRSVDFPAEKASDPASEAPPASESPELDESPGF